MMTVISLQPEGWSQCVTATQSSSRYIPLQSWPLSFLHSAAQVVFLHTRYTLWFEILHGLPLSHCQVKDQVSKYVLSYKTLHELTLASSLALTLMSKHSPLLPALVLEEQKCRECVCYAHHCFLSP